LTDPLNLPDPSDRPVPARTAPVRRSFLRRAVRVLVVMTLVLGVIGGAAVGALVWHFSRDLPPYQALADYQPPIMTRVHAGDGRVIGEFATERRVFVPIAAMPKLMVQAFLSAEDKGFYSHPGISLPDIVRAATTNLLNYSQGRRPVGASTITQQVAKNFLLSNEVSLERKAKEALLALRIEQVLSKDRILELYLNEIYLGYGSYGVAAAALNYFDKSLDDLTVAEVAYIAALPKAPNNYHPFRQTEAAKQRRDWVIGRMEEDGVLTAAQAAAARTQPLGVRQATAAADFRADYFVEEVRRELMQRFGETATYKGGLSVRTSLDPRLQAIAERSLRDGLIAYDRRHGWRGAFGKIEVGQGWQRRLDAQPRPPGLAPWQLAVVLAVTDQAAEIGLTDGRKGTIPLAELAWARQTLPEQRLGPAIRKVSEVLGAGDVIAVELIATPPARPPVVQAAAAAGAAAGAADGTYGLRQIPNVGGALVALDPHTGRVLAMSGGFSYEISQFNRVTQALRQPGSAFKPFVYLAALDHGFTPASIILDAPVVADQGAGMPKWKPSNYSGRFYGPAPLRVGIEQSRNLMTVRLVMDMGMEPVVEVSKRLGIFDQAPPLLSLALGSAETTLLKLAGAYAMIVNGGLKVKPTLIDRIQDRTGATILRHDQRPCESCAGAFGDAAEPPAIPDDRERVVEATTAYQMVSIMQGVIDRGTGARLRSLNRPLAGKTGTTNDSFDAWFVGFSPDLVAGVYIGFDNPRTLGASEQGASAAVPVFGSFMGEALKGRPAVPFRVPPGIRLVRIDPQSGRPTEAGGRAIWEAFKAGTETNIASPALDDGGGAGQIHTPAGGAQSTGGLY